MRNNHSLLHSLVSHHPLNKRSVPDLDHARKLQFSANSMNTEFWDASENE